MVKRCACLLSVAIAVSPAAGSRADTTTPVRLTIRGAYLDAHLLVDRPVRAPAAEPSDVERELQRALASLEAGHPQEANDILHNVLRANADNTRARAMAAAVLIQTERYREARDLMEDMLKRDPENYSLMNNLSWLYATSRDSSYRDPARAIRLAREALLYAPTDFHVWSTLAEAHFMNREYVMAKRAAAEALRLSVEQGASPSQRRVYQEQTARCEKAVRAFSLVE